MRDQERAPRKYELMTILHPEVAEEALPVELDRIAGYIADAGGELIESLRESPWGRRRLSYPIRSGGRDVRDGFYTVWHFSIGPTRLNDLERELKLNTQVIRYLILSWEPKVLSAKELEAAEIAAEEAAAAEYAAAQAAADAAEEAAASEFAAAEAAEAASADVADATPVAAGIVAQVESAEELTAEAEAAEASGAELAIEPVEERAQALEPVAAVEERAELEEEAAAALAKAAEAAAAEAAPEPDAAAAATADDTIPAGAIRGTESGECPEDYPVKGNASSMLYHTPGSPAYKRTIPEYCFASVEAAEAAGFGPTKFEAAQEEEGA